jgi:hypothetical protein
MVTRAPTFSEKTGAHQTCTDGEDAKGDQEATCVVPTPVRSSTTAVVVARPAARRSAAFHLGGGLFGARDRARGVIGNAASDMRWLGSFVPSTPPRATTRRRARRPRGRVLVHAVNGSHRKSRIVSVQYVRPGYDTKPTIDQLLTQLTEQPRTARPG